MSRPIPPSYETKKWPAYDEALKQRGSLTIWFDPDMAWGPPPTGKRGRQADAAGRLAVEAANGVEALEQRGLRLQRLRQQTLARRGEAQPVGAAAKEARGQLRLQRLDLSAHGGMGAAHGLRCAAQRSGAGHGKEGGQGFPVHR